jgi:ribose-phosphate pyrophosphokinase
MERPRPRAEAGAASVHAAATHGLFSGEAHANLAAAPLGRIVVTDTVPLAPGAPGNVEVCSCADLLADSVRRIFTGSSVSEVFEGQNQIF